MEYLQKSHELSRKCQCCFSPKSYIEVEWGYYLYCPNFCNSMGHIDTLGYVFVCERHVFEWVRKEQSNGIVLRKQCRCCGEKDPRSYKKSLVDNFDELPLFEDKTPMRDFSSMYYNGHIPWYKGEFKEGHPTHQDIKHAYYKSEDWRARRAAVFARDNWICQCCLKNKAQQVHHLRYDNFRNEPLWDLVSICMACHGRFESTRPVEKLIELQS